MICKCGCEIFVDGHCASCNKHPSEYEVEKLQTELAEAKERESNIIEWGRHVCLFLDKQRDTQNYSEITNLLCGFDNLLTPKDAGKNE